MKVCKGIDYVFMCAANTSGALIMKNTPMVHLTPNVVMNVNMLEAAYEMGVQKFLFISSNTVYPLTDFPVKESDVTPVKNVLKTVLYHIDDSINFRVKKI